MTAEMASVVGVCVGVGSNERGRDRAKVEGGQNRCRRALEAIERLGFPLGTKWEPLESFGSNYASYSRNFSHLSLVLTLI